MEQDVWNMGGGGKNCRNGGVSMAIPLSMVRQNAAVASTIRMYLSSFPDVIKDLCWGSE